MRPTSDLRAARRKWRELEDQEELTLLRLLLNELPNSPGGGLETYERERLIPKLTMISLQLREHSRSLNLLTWALIGLTAVLVILTALAVANFVTP